MNRKFKVGDIVTCSYSSEIVQPMVVDGFNTWCLDVPIYYVKGKHRKNGNDVIITLTEGVLERAL